VRCSHTDRVTGGHSGVSCGVTAGLGRPWTPRVSAGGVASSTMCASGAMAYAHWTSSLASTDQPAAEHGPEMPFDLVQV